MFTTYHHFVTLCMFSCSLTQDPLHQMQKKTRPGGVAYAKSTPMLI